MNSKNWQAKWIVDPEFLGLEPINVFHKEHDPVTLPPHRPELRNRHMFVRKTFIVPETCSSVFLDITADDYYKLYVNGEFVSQGPASGYHSDYRYNRHDITSLLNPGRNVIAVDVYYQGLINRVWNSGDYRQGMIAELFIDEQLVAFSDPSWKCFFPPNDYEAPTSGYETQFCERIDNRLIPCGWRSVDFNDDNWSQAVENPKDDHQLILQQTPPLEVYSVFPKHVTHVESGHYVVDFGHEVTGQFSAIVRGNAGDEMIIRCGQELNADGSVRYQMRCNCVYDDSFTLAGTNDEIIEFYDYKTFRYVEIVGPEQAIDAESFSAVVRHYPFDESACEFKSSNPLLEQIWEICKNSIKYCCQENYVDCPDREKGQYLGDSFMVAHSQVYLTGDLRLLHKAIEDFSRSALICPGLLAVAPGSFMQEIANWSLLFPLMLRLHYRHSGDTEFLRRMLPVAENMINHFWKFQRADGLLEAVTDKWNLVDWPVEMNDDYDVEQNKPIGPGCHNIINAYYLGAVKTVDELRAEFNLPPLQDFDSLKEAFVKTFYRPETGLFADSETSNHSASHSNVLPLYHDLVPLEYQKRIVDFIKEKGMVGGPYFAYFLLPALARIGEYETLWMLLISEGPDSWANMIREGATSTFEAWGLDRKWNTSTCHATLSYAIMVIVENLLGLVPGEPGWKSIHFDPHLPDELQSIYLKFPISGGTVVIEAGKDRCRLIREISSCLDG